MSRVVSAVADGKPVRRRDGVSLAAVKAARTLLSFGANVEVMSPPEVRADLAAVASEIVDLYSNLRLD